MNCFLIFKRGAQGAGRHNKRRTFCPQFVVLLACVLRAACTVCPAGEISSVGATVCTPSPMGSYVLWYEHLILAGSSMCQPNSPGIYVKNAQIINNRATYTKIGGAWHIYAFQLNSFQSISWLLSATMGVMTRNAESPTDSNTVPLTGWQEFCTTTGWQKSPLAYSIVIGFTHELCAAGKYKDTIGTAPCTDCPLGTYNSVPGATSCQLCPASSQRLITDRTQCVFCAENKTLNTLKTQCVCDAGFEAGTVANNDQHKCHLCKPGTASPLPGFPCLNCAVNSYAAFSGQVKCDSCPEGIECPRTGPTSFSALAGADMCQGNNIRKLQAIESFAHHKLYYVTH